MRSGGSSPLSTRAHARPRHIRPCCGSMSVGKARPPDMCLLSYRGGSALFSSVSASGHPGDSVTLRVTVAGLSGFLNVTFAPCRELEYFSASAGECECVETAVRSGGVLDTCRCALSHHSHCLHISLKSPSL